ncbi:FAD-binding oxidoreductase [Kaustia mangrovi]|uniref:FAD-binding oxidoreductase n=1 Tax=Kaustia mangrovi TaxID=2593653 RepID=A0A7S8HBI4_9HYPH|nr:FAD-binding oxidoreductase [Kaustia mangrovi]QPC42630.1 FAD-binding oxidoreductase [Kaustia mangrovi]
MTQIRELQAPTLPRSLWAATAVAPKRFDALEDDIATEVAVVGGGFTGLSTALHLSERGIDVAVIEAAEPGWGASGRNGGQVIPGLKYDPDELEAMFGADLGGRMAKAAGEAPDVVFDIVARYGLDCEADRRGWIQAAFGRKSLETLTRRARQWQARGVAARALDGAEATRLIGGKGYVGGWADPRGGGLQPLSYARELARVAAGNGARIFAATPATKLSRSAKGWRVETPGGSVTAATVILATNGYTDALWPGLERSVIPVYSFQIATVPLSENLRRTVLPEGHVVSDSRRLLRYFRLDSHGRLLMGGRSPFTDRPTFEDGRTLKGWIEEMFPQLGDVEMEYVWSGRVAVTADHLPHLNALAPGVYAALGFNGRGVAMTTQMGRILADLASGTPAEELPFPVTSVQPIRFHGFYRPVLEGLVRYYRLRDRWEAAKTA